MAYKDLREFIGVLESQGELVRIKEPISRVLEITEVTDRVSKKGGPALLFENVVDSDYPVLINAMGSTRRMNLAFERQSLDALAEELESFIDLEKPETLLDKLRMLPKLKRMGDVFPKKILKAPCQEVVEEEVNLDRLPVLTCWPEDGGPFVTLPLVFTKHPRTGQTNMGMYRLQVYDRQTTGMHWHTHKGGAQHYRVAEAMGEPLPVAVAIGTDPVTTYVATAPLPEDMDELLLAGLIRKRPVEVAPCKTVDLLVPAHAEFILEGYVNPKERRREGPFGDHTGYYSLADDYPIFHVSCVTHKRSPIYSTTIVGRPPMEDCYMAKATERIFLPILKKTLPEIVDLNLPMEGVFHNLVFVSIDKRYPGHAQKIMHAFWGLGQMMFAKIIVVFDGWVDVQNLSQALWVMCNCVDPERDVCFVKGPVDALDHAAPLPLLGSKMGIDATRPWPEEGHLRPWPKVIEMEETVKRKIDQIWDRLGIPGFGRKSGPS
ncbi:MAG: menaquinone biosynthesis decarboxylase [Deltaproteobacteria bacterium]|nr:menaquinone biosynthesis decarboxylase [Deltaproteobacteria bacterium]